MVIFELRLGQLVGAFLLHGVLRGQHDVRLAHGIGRAVHGGLPLLHHLEQGRLRLGRSAVDFVHQHDVGKHRPAVELELAALHVKHRRAQHITRHEVRGELDTAEVRIDETRRQFGKQRLGHARHTFEQHMSVSQDSRKQ